MENRNKPESLRGDILKQNSNVTQLILPQYPPLFFLHMQPEAKQLRENGLHQGKQRR
jgi:hypothetical protein